MQQVVRVQQGDIRRVDGLERRKHGVAQAEVLLVDADLDPGVRDSARPRDRLVGRAVVDDQELERLERLAEHAAHRLFDVGLVLVGRNQHRYVGVGRRARGLARCDAERRLPRRHRVQAKLLRPRSAEAGDVEVGGEALVVGDPARARLLWSVDALELGEGVRATLLCGDALEQLAEPGALLERGVGRRGDEVVTDLVVLRVREQPLPPPALLRLVGVEGVRVWRQRQLGVRSGLLGVGRRGQLDVQQGAQVVAERVERLGGPAGRVVVAARAGRDHDVGDELDLVRGDVVQRCVAVLVDDAEGERELGGLTGLVGPLEVVPPPGRQQEIHPERGMGARGEVLGGCDGRRVSVLEPELDGGDRRRAQRGFDACVLGGAGYGERQRDASRGGFVRDRRQLVERQCRSEQDELVPFLERRGRRELLGVRGRSAREAQHETARRRAIAPWPERRVAPDRRSPGQRAVLRQLAAPAAAIVRQDARRQLSCERFARFGSVCLRRILAGALRSVGVEHADALRGGAGHDRRRVFQRPARCHAVQRCADDPARQRSGRCFGHRGSARARQGVRRSAGPSSCQFSISSRGSDRPVFRLRIWRSCGAAPRNARTSAVTSPGRSVRSS